MQGKIYPLLYYSIFVVSGHACGPVRDKIGSPVKKVVVVGGLGGWWSFMMRSQVDVYNVETNMWEAGKLNKL